MAYLESWIEERNPDVVGLQELKMVDETFPVARFQELGYYSASHGQKAWNGVAISEPSPDEGDADWASRSRREWSATDCGANR